jgi:hypothetical protein
MGVIMESKATYDDVNLILRLYELRREEKLRQARDWFVKSFHASTIEEFQALCPMGSETNAYFRMVVSYWEMVASFIVAGVLNKELFFQSGGELLFVWERTRDMLPLQRQAFKSPHMMKNLETVANSMIEWMNARSPEAYGAFSAFVRTRPAQKT